MRNLAELNINEGGRPVVRAIPSAALIHRFESHFGVKLPDDYLLLLRHANGGHPEIDSFEQARDPSARRWSVNRFYHLGDEKDSTSNLWTVTEKWQQVLGNKAIPFATDGGGNQFFLDLNTKPPSVRICVHDEDFVVVELAPSFAAFIDGLTSDPEMI